ncbi:hypothetical protein SAMN04488030_0050 [Aliiroseovarius halocynthiae]|nr:hypothetical protein SAMN04488030_0050 [Aliiroseovarius halocynthiae]
MPAKGERHHGRRGFALIAVLFGLATLTTLYAVTAARVVAARTGLATEEMLVGRAGKSADILRLAAGWLAEPDRDLSQGFTITLGGQVLRVTAVDVGGQIDLNTARPELLERAAAQFGIDADALAKFRQWRRAPNRVQRVEDLYRVSGIDRETTHAMRLAFTVYSGRRGVAKGFATGEAAAIVGADADAWNTPRSGTNFLILVHRDGQVQIAGIVHSAQNGEVRVLRVG